ncbi:MAG: FAD-dependent oxidoreductase, partial [Proteobacteria bacterium]|nr:FAD-dependent oxidoreductase [Pseudomonadota bacterium]
MNERVVIVGAGLAGLSAGLELGPGCEVFERENEPGGLCRSERVEGFTFDYGGHLLHFRDRRVRELVFGLLGPDLIEHQRSAWIYSKNTFTPFPFQVNLHGLPLPVVWECLWGFIKTQRAASGPLGPTARRGSRGHGVKNNVVARFIGRIKAKNEEENFEQWIYRKFGKGIAKHFMIPFNQKFWRVPLAELTREWAEWSIPQPGIPDVVRGALGFRREGLGYNPVFYYPRGGGIDRLTGRLAEKVGPIQYGRELLEVDPEKKKIKLDDGRERDYDRLVSTIPLPELLKKIRPAGESFPAGEGKLDCLSVAILNLGVKGELPPYHWIYFPESDFPFYRVNISSNFSPAMAPPGCGCLWLEATLREGEAFDREKFTEASIEGLIRCGLLQSRDQVVLKHYQQIEYGYVVFNRYRQLHLREILASLEKRGIYSIGRYGGWDYLTMEGAIQAGREAAEKIN